MADKVIFDTVEIRKILLHRYPFLLVDRVVEFEDGERIVGIKNVTCNEPYFQGHFPMRPIMPGVLMLEAMAQTGAILCIRSKKNGASSQNIVLAGADEFRWKRLVNPGDVMRIELKVLKARKAFWVNHGLITVDGEVVCEGILRAAETIL
jgi:3-hydroxyacyl-[acyl-carrier-protein] dehydratase